MVNLKQIQQLDGLIVDMDTDHQNDQPNKIDNVEVLDQDLAEMQPITDDSYLE
jgi:methyl coenzyme M reductase subunit C-like uncharacterized protein (methanogenesis marker protein 7)